MPLSLRIVPICIKEYMKVMGLSPWLHWFTYFLFNIAKLSIPMAVITAILKVYVGGVNVLVVTDATVLYVFLMMYAMAGIWYTFAVSTFFNDGYYFS
jgi:hypothetical protein